MKKRKLKIKLGAFLVAVLMLCVSVQGCAFNSGDSKNEITEDDYISLRDSLVDTTNEESVYASLDKISDESDQTVIYILMGETNRYNVTKETDSKTTVKACVNWLIDNSDDNNDGNPGWGIGFEWDAFSDGSVNPGSTEYAIQVAEGIDALTEAINSGALDSETKAKAVDLLKEIVLLWSKEYFTISEDGKDTGYYWYSQWQRDAVDCPNIQAKMSGAIAKFTNYYGDSFSQSDLDTIKSHAQFAVNDLKYYMMGDELSWPYSVGKNNDNDLVHQVFILYGIDQYNANCDEDKKVDIYSEEKRDEHLQKYFDETDDKVYNYTIESKKDISATPFSVGSYLGYLSMTDNFELADNVIKAQEQTIEGWPEKKVEEGKNVDSTSREKAFILWGFSYYIWH